MISIVVSSYNQRYFESFSENVELTIGDLAYEIVKIENPGIFGICEAYNKGNKIAKYPYIVFAHEDVLFHTKNWGLILIDTFNNDEEVGLIGVIGSFYKSFIYSGWLTDQTSSSMYMIGSHFGESIYVETVNGVIQTFNLKSYEKKVEETIEKSLFYEEVIAIDGLFMATKKNIVDDFPFDENIFKGFHCYDVDFSLQVRQKYKVIVTHNILVEHFSYGNFNKNWLENTVLLHIKWRKELPINSKRYSLEKVSNLEFIAFVNLLRVLKGNNVNLLFPFKQILSRLFIKKLGFINWLHFLIEINRYLFTLIKKYAKL